MSLPVKKSSGQALLVTLLVLSVVLTTGLSLVARTITDIAISEEETQSQEAFEAAEAGVEEALHQLQSGTVDINPADLANALEVEEMDVTISNFEASEIQEISPGETVTIWLNHFELDGEDFPNSKIDYTDNSVKICWNDPADKLEAAVYYQTGGYKVARYLLNDTEGCSGLDGLDRGTTLSPLPAGGSDHNKFINIRYYDTDPDSTLAVAADESGLPVQGKIVKSTAQEGDVSRKIQVKQGWPRPPEFFDFVLFSAAGLSKWRLTNSFHCALIMMLQGTNVSVNFSF